jgi:xylose dehydrogenase (NAD/NADP)
VLARFETSIVSAERHGAQLVGTSGTIVLPLPWVQETADTAVILRRWLEPDHVIPVPAADTYRLEVEDFARAVTTGTPARWPVDDAVANMAVIDALFASAKAHARAFAARSAGGASGIVGEEG